MRFWKKKESTMWRSAKFAIVAACVIGIGANSISVIPTGYTGVKSTFGKVSEKELTTGIHFSAPFVQKIQTISNKQQDATIADKIWGEASDKTPVYAENVTVTYNISVEKSVWLYSNVTNMDNIINNGIVASAVKSAMGELGPEAVTNRGKVEPLAQQKLIEAFINCFFCERSDFTFSFASSIAVSVSLIFFTISSDARVTFFVLAIGLYLHF